MRSKLLLSTAMLLAGIGLASAQGMPGGGASPSPGGSPGGAATPSQPHGSPTQREPGKQGQAGQREQGKQGGPKSETTGQAPQGKEQPKAGGKEQPKAGGKEQPKAQERRDQTTGQSKQPSTQTQPGAQAPTTGQAPRQPGQPGQAPQGQAQQGQTGGSVTLTPEQRTRIRQTVLVAGAPRVSSVNFALSVGTAVPTSVHVVEVAPVLVEIHPEWRGFYYFVVGDEIIIVDRSHRIVAVVAV